MIQSFMIITGVITPVLPKIHDEAEELAHERTAGIIGIERCRLLTDGQGVTTLVGFYDCPLRCKFCINPQCHDLSKAKSYSPRSLYNELLVDDLYFQATGGGITFGGGEPGLYADFIEEFATICGKKWKIALETSLNIELENLKVLLPLVNEWIVDIKDTNNKIYMRYTKKSNRKVIRNLQYIADQGMADKVVLRLPLIPQFNTAEDVEKSKTLLTNLGFSRFEELTYRTSVLDDKKNGDYGKAVCEVLKEIRKQINDANHTNVPIHDCPHSTCSTGHCPTCDQEAKLIMNGIMRKKQNNEPIHI